MKILLVTRGSQGDIYPYLNIASALIKRGHKVTLNLPQIFEKEAQAYQLDYVLQDFDDIQGMVSKAGNKSEGAKPYLKWMRDVIDAQFKQLVPLLKEHDVLIATNFRICCGKCSGLLREAIYPYRFCSFHTGKEYPASYLSLPEASSCIYSPYDLADAKHRKQLYDSKDDQQEPEATGPATTEKLWLLCHRKSFQLPVVQSPSGQHGR